MLCRLVCVLLLIGWIGEWPLARDQVLYHGLWRSPLVVFGPLFVSVPGLNLFPWQILLLAAVPVCLLQPHAFRNRAWILDATIIVSVAAVVLTFLWGWLRGSSAYQAYYQLWRFLAALMVCLLLNSVIHRSRDLRALGITILVAAITRGGLCIYFYWAHVRGQMDPPPAYMVTHDDTLLFVSGLLVSVTWAIARATRLAWLSAAGVTALLLYAIVLNNRRLAWIELILAFGLLFFLLPIGLRRRVTQWGLVAGPFVVAYVAAGWGRAGAFFAPIRALSTAGSHENLSALARQEEIRNLLYTLSSIGNPLLGTGWGVGYREASSLYTYFGGGFWQYPFLPHNSLLGVAVFGGFVGLFGIWLVVPVTALLAMRGHQEATNPVDRAAAITILCMLPAFSVQCYGDIGFQALTCLLLLGVAMGAAGKLAVWAEVSARRRRQLQRAA
jgi:hypothetical protein